MDAEENIKEACRLGVLAFIVKPLTAEKFWPVIQELKKLHIGPNRVKIFVPLVEN